MILKFHQYKICISINDIDTKEIVVSNFDLGNAPDLVR